jgi:hypothetical protein
MYSSVADVATMLQREVSDLTIGEADKITLLLQNAAALLQVQVPQLDARIAAGSLDADVVAAVSTAMVHRVMLNPDGRRQNTVSVDDASTSWTVDVAVSTGALYLSDQERAVLMPPAATLRVGTMKLGYWS